jgi:cytochrome d ubiquinol oxidase subunit II
VIADAVGAILLASVSLYAILGGADFGGGLWDLVAGGDQRGRAPRGLIDESITPVWEANHVWLIFALVIFWTGFPVAFAAVMVAAALPLWLALFGIVLRGAGFAFRKEVSSLPLQRLTGAAFAFSSLVTPFFMGTVVGGIAAGQIPADASHALLSAWTGPESLLTGFLFVGAGGYLAAVYLIEEAARAGDRRLETYFIRRAQAAGVVTGALSLAALLELHNADLAVFNRLTGRALPLVIVTAASGVAVLVLVTIRRPRGIRVLAALGVATVIWGWGVAQYPTVLPGTAVTLSNAGAPHATLVALIVLFVAVAVIIGPSFALLFALQGRRALQGESGLALAGASAGTSAGGGQPATGSSRPAGGSVSHPGRAAVLGLVAVGAIIRALARRRRGR